MGGGGGGGKCKAYHTTRTENEKKCRNNREVVDRFEMRKKEKRKDKSKYKARKDDIIDDSF